MCSRCRIELLACVAMSAAMLAGCHQASPTATFSSESPDRGIIASALVPGLSHSASSSDPRAAQYLDNAQAVTDGKRLYNQYNCVGCHSNGGGGMGPPLMDDQWIYGDRLEQIHQTLVEGRPNGMPSWGGKIPDPQLWELAAYVRSMSLPETIAANTGPTPSQTPAAVPRAVEQDAGWTPPPGTTNDYTDVTKGP